MLFILAVQSAFSSAKASCFYLIQAYREVHRKSLHGYAADLVSALDTMAGLSHRESAKMIVRSC